MFFCTAKINEKMGNILKYLGVFIVIVGVAFLAIPAFMEDGSNNMTLSTGGILLVVGLIVHIFVNKYSKE